MSAPLSGNLAELGLDDILRIISVSRKTGILTIKALGREAVLQCRNGLVIRATSTGFHQSLGELMIHNGVVDSSTVRAALSIQQKEGFRERIGTILHTRYQVSLQLVEKSVRQQIYSVVMSIFTWGEGNFDFAPKEDIETVDAAYLDPLQLVMEQSALIDELSSAMAHTEPSESKQPESDDFASFYAHSHSTGSGQEEAQTQSLVIVDDDMATAEAVANGLADDKLEPFPLSRSEEALLKIDSMFKSGRRPLVLLDLIMPRMDGSGVLGGLELLKILRGNFPELPVIMMTDFRHAEAEAECAGYGCKCILKPRRGNVESEEFSRFTVELRKELNRYLVY